MPEKTKTEQLRDLVASLFENATQREQIEGLVRVNDAIDAVEKEQHEMEEKNADLVKSYKELIKHTSFKVAPSEKETQPKSAPSLEATLNDFLAKQKKDK